VIKYVCCFFFFLFALFFSENGLSASRVTQHIFSVEDILQMGDLGAASFSPDGQRLVVEKIRSFQEANGYGSHLNYGLGNSEVWVKNIKSGKMNKIQVPGADGVSSGPWSPDGRKILIYSFSRKDATVTNRGVSIGIWNIITETYQKLPGAPASRWHMMTRPAIWLGPETVIYSILCPRIMSRTDINAGNPDTIMHLVDKWKKTWQGKEASYSILESGFPFIAEDRKTGQLLRVNISTGKQKILAEGEYSDLQLVPGSASLLALRNGPAYVALSHEKRADAGSDDLFRKLVLVDVEGRKEPQILSGRLNVFSFPTSSVSLSPDGTKAAFYGGEIDKDWHNAQPWVYDLVTHRLQNLKTDSLEFHDVSPTGLHSYRTIRWLRNMPLILSDAGLWQLSSEQDPTAILVPGITKSISQVYQQGDRVLLIAGGSLYDFPGGGLSGRLIYDDQNRLLTGIAIPGPVPAHIDTLPVITQKDGKSFKGFLDMETGQLTGVDAGASFQSGSLVAFAPDMSHVLYRVVDEAGKKFVLSKALSEREQTILTVNQHLNQIRFGKKKKVTYALGKGEDQRNFTGWVLLPPDYQRGKLYPAVVSVYGGRDYNTHPADFVASRQEYANYYNLNLLTAAGYAVLLVSLPIDFQEEPLDIPKQLAQITLAAVDRLIDMKISAPDRLALMGTSYGGYSTLSILTQTGRFRAGIAISGVYNLTSAYGGFWPTVRIQLFAQVFNWAKWMEGHQGGMAKGEAPWVNPQKYIRNSPLFFADRVTTPVLFLHGDLDPVSIAQTEEMFNALYRQGKKARFVRLWGEVHGIYSPANIRLTWHEILRWLGEVMK